MSSFWHAHNHSHYSVLDGMSPVKRLVQRAHKLNQPAMGLTDHGVMSGVFQLYSECRKLDMIPFPGIELYVVDDVSDKGGDRFHLTLNAFTTAGYKFLVKLSSLSHDRSRLHLLGRS
jgi:DNA polymerase-3 subunit alpha